MIDFKCVKKLFLRRFAKLRLFQFSANEMQENFYLMPFLSLLAVSAIVSVMFSTTSQSTISRLAGTMFAYKRFDSKKFSCVLLRNTRFIRYRERTQ